MSCIQTDAALRSKFERWTPTYLSLYVGRIEAKIYMSSFSFERHPALFVFEGRRTGKGPSSTLACLIVVDWYIICSFYVLEVAQMYTARHDTDDTNDIVSPAPSMADKSF